ncbi:MAG TPA: YfiR family protein [Candidatus Angelobacter sp.]|nr:YfiR family protein [Candidatus Angelobacter sp.]
MKILRTKSKASRRSCSHAVSALFLLLALISPGNLPANSAAEEYAVKAAFLFHFAQFVEWPAVAFPDPQSPLTYCTLGQDPFHGALDASLNGKTIGARALRVRHLKAAQDAQGCQVLFFGGMEKKSMLEALSSVRGMPVLTVGETENFVGEGGMIGFCLVENKVRFDINLDTAEKARLKISSRLLSLAKSVVNSSGGQ